MLQLNNYGNVTLNKETLLLLHPLGDFEQYGLLYSRNLLQVFQFCNLKHIREN